MRGLHAARAALVTGVVGLCGGAFTAMAGSPAADTQPVLTEIEMARMPSGLAALCERDPSFCRPVAPRLAPLELTAANRALLSSVNSAINHRIRSTTDEKLYGRPEYWTIPDTAGDCEDFVLLKRRTLIADGFPAAALLITVVHDENGEGHAVLTVPTTSGDLVLDNRRDAVLPWQETGYLFVKRQSAANPNVWVSLAREKLQATDIASGPEALVK